MKSAGFFNGLLGRAEPERPNPFDLTIFQETSMRQYNQFLHQLPVV
jgi:hypothetical protein